MRSLSIRSISTALFSTLFLGTAAPSEPGPSPAQVSPVGLPVLPVLERAKDIGPANGRQSLSIAVSMPYARPREVQAFVDSVNDPGSVNYRKYITPEEVGERFGLPMSQVDAVADHLRQNGFTITLVSKNHLAILANATVAQAEAAFHTTIREYTLVPQDNVEPSRFIAYSTPIQLPANLASIVIDVSGLETYTHPKHLVTLLTPVLTRGLYNTVGLFNAGFTGAGRTIGISNWVGFRASNWLSYINHFMLPIPAGGAGTNIATIPCGGGGAGAGPDNPEGDLDVQMELGMAPLANIKIYDGTSNNLVAVLTQQVNDNLADAISESYGWNIPGGTASAAHNQHLSMSAQGITYMAASGDSGTTLEPYSYPDYEPEVLSVGGTVANVNSTTGVRITEVGWSGGGGGWSNNSASFNVRPVWQVGTGVPPITGTNNHRLVPDVGFHSAGSGTGAYWFYFNNALTGQYIGTSFASPILAGMLAIVEQKIINLGGLPPDGSGHRRFGRIQDLLYGQNGRPDVWFDITSGANGNLPNGSPSTCTAGWDTVTGWGPMNCEAFTTLFACGVDTDGDGTPDCTDGCPNDPNKIAPGQCGCGVADTDTDGDGTADCIDGCPNDPLKIAPGQCGCGLPDTDSDGDGTANCIDNCPTIPNANQANADGDAFGDACDTCTDTDGDGYGDPGYPNNTCPTDGCPNDPNKIAPGVCGCGVPDIDSDGDGTMNCNDGCPNDPNKIAPGQCGCGVADTDTDGDGTANCNDGCPNDPNKIAPGACGCGVAETDTDQDGVPDCVDNCPSINNPFQEDCDGNGIGDVCDIAAGAPDCNMNGVPDGCDVASGTSQDLNFNGVPDECQQPGGISFCFGNGAGGPCPCSNNGGPGRGCANSGAGSTGALLTAAGNTVPDTIVLTAAGERPTALSIFLQGNVRLSPGIPFGDGKRCAGGTLKRLGVKNAVGGVTSYPQAGDPSITARSAALGDPIPSGGIRIYQVYYRDPSTTYCPDPPGGTFNATQAVQLVW